ncbi:MAG: hypothetical protein ABIP75_16330 [Pyrinomonadaceae bacterium]
MKKSFLLLGLVFSLLTVSLVRGQNPAAPQPQTPPVQRQEVVDLSEFGVRIQTDPRLIVMMVALQAAGLDPTPSGKSPSLFRAEVIRDLQNLDPDLRRRMKEFFDRNNKALAGAPFAEQAARYISLAYAIGPVPGLESPERTDDLPGGLLDVLDFAPLVREFYNKSELDEHLPAYVKKYQAVGDDQDFRRTSFLMARAMANYLHTRPQLTATERVTVKSPGSGKDQKKAKVETREHERRFFIVPDLLAVSGTINLRVIGDDYYVILPERSSPAASEVRRAYLRYLLDPVIFKYAKDISAQRSQVAQVIASQSKATTTPPDVFSTVARSLIVGADVRQTLTGSINYLSVDARNRLDATTDPAARTAITKELSRQKTELNDESVLQLAEAYEDGAYLAFYFAEQMEGIESSGFDIAQLFPDMMASFSATKEMNRLGDLAVVRDRATKARAARRTANQNAVVADDGPGAVRRAALAQGLNEADALIKLRNYDQADAKLKQLLFEFPGEPRIFFALGRTASLSAQEVTDEVLQAQRLNRAFVNYQNVVLQASAEAEPALVSRAHAAMGRILEFMEKSPEAMKEYESAIRIGNIPGGAYQDALDGKARLAQKP